MTKRKRTLLFIACIVLFAVAAPIVVLYSIGYRFDFRKNSITQTGGLYFRVQPASATIEVFGGPRKKTDLLFGTLLMENIFPQNYRVSISKNGYIDWTKSLTVESKKVTEAKNITLVPESISLVKLDDNSARLYRSPKGNKVILEKYQNGTEYFAFIDRPSGNQEMASSASLFGNKQIYVHQLIFSNSEQTALLKAVVTDSKNPQRYYLLNYRQNNKAQTAPAVQAVDNIPISAKGIKFDPNDNLSVFYINNNSLWKTQINNIPAKLVDDVVAFSFDEGFLYYLDSRGYFYKNDINLSSRNRINDNPFAIKEDNEYEIYSYGDILIFTENNFAHKFDANNQQFNKLLDRVSEIRPSPDKKKLAIVSGSELWVLYLVDDLDAPRKRAGELVFITRFSSDVRSVYWYTLHYLVFAINDVIKIAEIDNRDTVNIAEPVFVDNTRLPILLKGTELIFNEKTRQLCLLSTNTFYCAPKAIN